MKVVILAGGLGTRISEESHLRPKPMIEIGGKPILWHIMKIYSHYGFNDFIICLGYKGYIVKEYFANYFLHTSDITFDFRYGNQITYHNHFTEPWKVTLVDTGLNSATGGRIKRVQPYIGNKRFMMTYGDGVANVDVSALVQSHTGTNRLITVTATQPTGRFGALSIDKDDTVKEFVEKPTENGAWINTGFFVLEPEIFNYIDGDTIAFEGDPLINVTKEGRLGAYKHTGFWQAMDTLRDKNHLEELWKSGKAPWKLWPEKIYEQD
ncbi:MAG: glucose-1-phosphate cytidylyltransferase [Ignavibacteria bacterium]